MIVEEPMTTENIMEWSRQVINTIMTITNNGHKYLYSIRIVLEPNPLNYDGMDEASIVIMRYNQTMKSTNLYFTTQSVKECFNLNEAIIEVNKFVVDLK